MYPRIFVCLMTFLRPVTAMSIEVPGGPASMLPSPGVTQHPRNRRQTFIYPSSSTAVAPPASDGSSAIQGVTMTLQDFDLENTEISFIHCLKGGGHSCELDLDEGQNDPNMKDIVEECGNSFTFNYFNTEFKCECNRDSVSCEKSPSRPKKQRPICNSFIILFCKFLEIDICDSDSLTTTTTTRATSPSSTTQPTSTPSELVTPASSPRTDIRAIEMTTSSDRTTFSIQTTVSALEDGTNGQLLGGIIGGVAGGAVLTIFFIILWSLCRRRMKASSNGNVTSSDVKVKEDDRRALCDKHSDAASSEYHTYELPDVIGTLPPYATSSDLTGPEVTSNDVDEYDRLGDHVKPKNGATHMYDYLDKTKLKLRQQVINNDYNHAVVAGEITVEDVSHQDNSQEPSDTTGAEDPPYYTIEQEDSGKGQNHKYFVLEKTEETPDTPPYSKLSFD
ncbi:uncharacterized protein LOC124134679 [Haliotis rufescens]|uniref:uncharacterized protein LOC124134679 n=1 Tax=Haliotis rufescens TaxID=6454 RepID=UPI00201EFE6B|nr:uncharacterized protein LOC124134679 [Haliotis rufescens]